MKLAIDQVGDYVSINDGRATTTLTREDFEEYLFGLKAANELIQDGRPNTKHVELFRSADWIGESLAKFTSPATIDINEVLKDLFEGA